MSSSHTSIRRAMAKIRLDPPLRGTMGGSSSSRLLSLLSLVPRVESLVSSVSSFGDLEGGWVDLDSLFGVCWRAKGRRVNCRVVMVMEEGRTKAFVPNVHCSLLQCIHIEKRRMGICQ